MAERRINRVYLILEADKKSKIQMSETIEMKVNPPIGELSDWHSQNKILTTGVLAGMLITARYAPIYGIGVMLVLAFFMPEIMKFFMEKK